VAEIPTVVRERMRAKLAQLAVALNRADYTTTMFEPTPDRPAPTLVVTLDPDEKKRPRELNVNLMPLGPGEADATDFLQFYVQFPFSAGEAQLATAQQAATIVNNHLAVGHFGVNAGGDVFFRYVLATPQSGTLDPELLKELMAFLDFTQQRFGDYLEGVCAEEISVLVLDETIQAAEAEPPF
jgi:hypothetical protein